MSGRFEPDWRTALALQDRGQAREALRHYREIGRRQARSAVDPSGLLETARRLGQLYDYETVFFVLEAAARIARDHPQWLLRIALQLRQEGLFAEAGRYARRVLDQRPCGETAAVDARLLLSECEERLGRLEASLALAEEVLVVRPGSIPAHRLRSVVLRRRGRLDEALAGLCRLEERGGPAHWETCRAWFELGQVRDMRGEHAGAWRAWTQARRHAPPGAPWALYRQQAEHVWRHVRSLHDSVTPRHFESWARTGTTGSHPPLAVLTGHPRSGTTLLEQALDAHSGVISVEETTLFTSAVYRPIFQHGPSQQNPAERLDTLTSDERAHWTDEYHELTRLALREPPGHRLLLDKNPDLLQLLPALACIFPAARIIVMLRDPRDILVSMFAQALPPNHTSYSYRDERSAGEMVALRLGLWLRLREILPRSAFHEVRYESAAANFPLAVQGALDFLGLVHESPTLDPAAHARGRIVHSPTYAAVREPVHTRAIGRWINYEEWMTPALEALRPVVAALGYDP